MPIYAYRCRKCDEVFESFRGIYDNDDSVACPKCGEKKPRRVLSSVFCQYTDGKGNLRFPT
jgi:putative FmdB family regulatory protein